MPPLWFARSVHHSASDATVRLLVRNSVRPRALPRDGVTEPSLLAKAWRHAAGDVVRDGSEVKAVTPQNLTEILQRQPCSLRRSRAASQVKGAHVRWLRPLHQHGLAR